MFASVILLSVALNQLVFAEPSKFKDCGSVKGTLIQFDVDPCDTQPCTLYKGENVIMKIVFSTKEKINSAKSVVHGVIGGIPIPFPLDDVQVCPHIEPTCPLDPSVTKYTYTMVFPVRKIYPSIKLTVKWQIQTEDDEDVICALIPAQIGPRNA